jgi:hypothetical protein
MRVLGILLRVCAPVVLAMLALPLVSASAYAHGGHSHASPTVQAQTPAACRADVGEMPCSLVAHANDIASSGAESFLN